MFTRHQFTCPDVIYLVNRQKKINRVTLGVSLIFWGGAYIYGQQVNKQIERNMEELHQS